MHDTCMDVSRLQTYFLFRSAFVSASGSLIRYIYESIALYPRNDESRVVLCKPSFKSDRKFTARSPLMSPKRKRQQSKHTHAAHEQIRDPETLCSLHIVNTPVGSDDRLGRCDV